MKKRDEKKETLLTCSYCHGCYHLTCIISNPTWNKDLINPNAPVSKMHLPQNGPDLKESILGKRSSKF